MSNSGVPGVEQIAQFTAGSSPNSPTPPPAAPSIGDQTQKKEEEERQNAGTGQSANLLQGDSEGFSTTSSKNVLLGS
jgi:hypothetical protein